MPPSPPTRTTTGATAGTSSASAASPRPVPTSRSKRWRARTRACVAMNARASETLYVIVRPPVHRCRPSPSAADVVDEVGDAVSSDDRGRVLQPQRLGQAAGGEERPAGPEHHRDEVD